MNFMGNLIIPAVSPRIYLAHFYEHPIEGYWVTAVIRGAITKAAANTFSAFPSGHCALSWLATLLAYRFGFVLYSKFCGAAAVMITTATLVLRYHYFVDFLFGLPLVAFGVWVGGLDTEILYQSSVYPELFEGSSSSAAGGAHKMHHSQRGGGLGHNYPFTSGGSGGATTTSGGASGGGSVITGGMAPAAATVLLGHAHHSSYFAGGGGSTSGSDDETGSTNSTETGGGGDRRHGPVVLLGVDDHHHHHHHSHSHQTDSTNPARHLSLSTSASAVSLSALAATNKQFAAHSLQEPSHSLHASGTPTAHAIISQERNKRSGGGVAMGSKTPNVTHQMTEVVLE